MLTSKHLTTCGRCTLRILFIFILFQIGIPLKRRDSLFNFGRYFYNDMMTKLQRFLGTEIDNSALILFRMFYGFLIFAESTGAILTGWVDQTFIKPQFTFSFIGFEWLQPLPAAGMYAWFVLMAMVGICIMLGFYYKVFSLLYFFLWSGIYFMQKTHYNNHHYLMVFLSFIMFLYLSAYLHWVFYSSGGFGLYRCLT